MHVYNVIIIMDIHMHANVRSYVNYRHACMHTHVAIQGKPFQYYQSRKTATSVTDVSPAGRQCDSE